MVVTRRPRPRPPSRPRAPSFGGTRTVQVLAAVDGANLSATAGVVTLPRSLGAFAWVLGGLLVVSGGVFAAFVLRSRLGADAHGPQALYDELHELVRLGL